jgi:hypothetical protein
MKLITVPPSELPFQRGLVGSVLSSWSKNLSNLKKIARTQRQAFRVDLLIRCEFLAAG